jgi:hypothetical protein
MPHRANRTSFKPGKSGNPSGRPKKTPTQREFEAVCRENADKALSVLLDVMRDCDASHRDRLQAVSIMLDRGFGKAVGRDVLLRLSGTADPTRMTDAQLIDFIGESGGAELEGTPLLDLKRE